MSDQNNLQLLISSNDKYIINQVQAVLNDNNIPFIQKDHETGGYMRIIGNNSLYQTDIFVGKNNFLLAKELINFLLIL